MPHNVTRPDLYWTSGSPPAWRVMLALAIKGVPFNSRRLDTDTKDNRAPSYLALNPKGQVLTLVRGDVVIRESLAIRAQLDRAFPERPIRGESTAHSAQIWLYPAVQWVSRGARARAQAPTSLRNFIQSRPPLAAWCARMDAFPDITFTSTEVQMLTPTTGNLIGDLEILGVTAPVELDFEMVNRRHYPAFIPNYDEVEVAGFHATGGVMRLDHGLDFIAFLGSPTGFEVTLDARFDLVRCDGAADTNVPCHWGHVEGFKGPNE